MKTPFKVGDVVEVRGGGSATIVAVEEQLGKWPVVGLYRPANSERVSIVTWRTDGRFSALNPTDNDLVPPCESITLHVVRSPTERDIAVYDAKNLTREYLEGYGWQYIKKVTITLSPEESAT